MRCSFIFDDDNSHITLEACKINKTKFAMHTDKEKKTDEEIYTQLRLVGAVWNDAMPPMVERVDGWQKPSLQINNLKL